MVSAICFKVTSERDGWVLGGNKIDRGLITVQHVTGSAGGLGGVFFTLFSLFCIGL